MGHAYHGQQGQLLPLSPHPFRTSATAVLLAALAITGVIAQRERIRLNPRPATRVNEAQKSELTLTMTPVEVRPVQVWVRTAGAIDGSRTQVTAAVPPGDARRLAPGQRVRAFSPASRSRMYQGTVSRQGDGTVTVTLMGRTLESDGHFVLEIVTEEGRFLSVPNEAIIERGGARVVYVQAPDGSYVPRDITTGVQGELFTQVLTGVEPGEQVVTIGSFFIDAEHRLKGP